MWADIWKIDCIKRFRGKIRKINSMSLVDAYEKKRLEEMEELVKHMVIHIINYIANGPI